MYLTLIVVISVIVLFFICFEVFYYSREKSPCKILPEFRTNWEITKSEHICKYSCKIPIKNFSHTYEATVRDIRPSLRVLAKSELPEDLDVKVKITPLYEDAREDGYWVAYIITPTNELDIKLDIIFDGNIDRINELHAIVIHLDYEIYSRRNLENHFTEIILAPHQEVNATLAPVEDDESIIYPIKTHLITDSDNMVDIVTRYVSKIAQPGDIVCMAESVVAITQHRYKHPLEVKPGWWARRLCYLIPNVGSLSSRYGMQTAIDEVGLLRMLLAIGVGAFFKLFGISGWLYRIAGMQSELIDDVTGTMAPFDKYIVMGPQNSQKLVDNIKAKTGLEAAVVDVNDIKRAFILACTSGVDKQKLIKQILNNPLGNSTQQTPIVLVRNKTLYQKEIKYHDQSCSV